VIILNRQQQHPFNGLLSGITWVLVLER